LSTSDTDAVPQASQNRKQKPSVVDIDDDNRSGTAIEVENSDVELGKQTQLNLNRDPYPMNLERLSKDWKASVYAFYNPIPEIAYINKRRCHEFKCAARGCKYTS